MIEGEVVFRKGSSQEFSIEMVLECSDTHVFAIFRFVHVTPRSPSVEDVLASRLTPEWQVERRVRHEQGERRNVSGASDLLKA